MSDCIVSQPALDFGYTDDRLLMDRSYVERREAGFYLSGSRVPLDNIVREYGNGEPPEAIRSHYPTLSLEQVYGAITYYLAHQQEVERVMREREQVEDAFHLSQPVPVAIREKLERARQQLPK